MLSVMDLEPAMERLMALVRDTKLTDDEFARFCKDCNTFWYAVLGDAPNKKLLVMLVEMAFAMGSLRNRSNNV